MTRNKLIAIISIILLLLVFLITFITARLRKPSSQEQPQDMTRTTRVSPTSLLRQPTTSQRGNFPTLSITLPVDPTRYVEDYSKKLDDVKKTDEFALKNYPDVYLANKCPFKNDFFSITEELIRDNGGYYRFNVTLNGDQSQSKEEFMKWLKNLGLKDTQIESLEIVYK